MRSKILGLLIAILATAIAPAQLSFLYTAQPNAPIPSVGTGGATGACSNSANKTSITLNSSDAVSMQDVNVSLNFSHSWATDLRITLSHGGVSVVLFDQHPATWSKHFAGTYTFDDQAFFGIAASVNLGPVLAPDAYQPQSPLSAFQGKSAAGPWTLEFCDLQYGDTGLLVDCQIEVVSGVWFEIPFQVGQPISDSGPYGCVDPLAYVINVPPGIGPISHTQLWCGLTHTRAADLTITVTHGPVTVTICSANTPSSNLQLGDLYTFDDTGSTSFDQALAAGGFYVPGDVYRPDSALSAFDGLDSAGTWFITICDAVPNNTGLVYYLALILEGSGYRFDLSQPSGSSSIILKNSGGAPGNHYLNAFTLYAGSFPSGWLNGLDIAVADLVYQVNWGVPFFGALDASGNSTITILGPIPTGLQLQFTSFELTPSGVPVNSISARSFTTTF